MLEAAFPFCHADDVNKVVCLISRKQYHPSEQMLRYHLHGVEICFPARTYFAEKSKAINYALSDRQKMILCCIYSRCHNGFVREKYIKLLLAMNYEEWTIPFIFKVCDEYVIEILETVYARLKGQDTERIRNFCLENHAESLKSYDRMVSYWNEYYRGYKHCHLSQYIGYKLFLDCFGIARRRFQ